MDLEYSATFTFGIKSNKSKYIENYTSVFEIAIIRIK